MNFHSNITQLDFLHEIAKSIGLKLELNIKTQTFIRMISKELLSNGESLLIIDDCHKIPSSFFNLIESLRKETLNSSRIILAGYSFFKNKIEKWNLKKVSNAREFHELLLNWEMLSPLSIS